MKKKIWIWNHYATNMYKNHGGRHYSFAENLIKRGYEPLVFCANTIHNSNEVIEISEGKYRIETVSEIPFVFVKTPLYEGNGLKRLNNMYMFYRNLFSVSKYIASKYGKPDVILASSVHPLTLIAGIKIAKKFGIPCICEIRDLWPESLVAYGILKKNNPIARILYHGEKWIYKKADAIIMTWQGGRDYIIDKGWKSIDLSKITHISNGVTIDLFDKNSENKIDDPDLDNNYYKNIVYTGSIRKVNNIGMLIDVAKIIKNQRIDNIRFLIFGSGDEKEMLEKRCIEENVNNVIFKDFVDKNFIPYILKKSYINILHNSSTSLDKYGQSQNKLFEYLASGRCILQTYTTSYNIIDSNMCGISVPTQNVEEIAKALISICEDDKKIALMGERARKLSYEYDFHNLTTKLIDVIEKL